MINIRKYGFAGLLGVVLTGSVARAISPDSLKDRLSEQDLSVDALRGEFGVKRLLAGESGMDIQWEARGEFLTRGDRRLLKYRLGPREITYSFDGFASKELRCKEGAERPVLIRRIGTAPGRSPLDHLAAQDFAFRLFDRKLSEYEFVGKEDNDAVVGYVSPVVGATELFKIQIYEETESAILAFAAAPDPGLYGYALVQFDPAKDCCLVNKKVHSTDGVLQQQTILANHVQVDGAWLPQRVSVIEYTKDKDMLVESARSEYSFKNFKISHDLDESSFEIPTPPDALVRDESR